MRSSSTLSVAAAASLGLLAGVASAADTQTWKAQSIYQVMIDRYARTDGSLDECDVLHKFCNGTWRGLIDKLDYIQDMGFTALQISPVIKNTEDDTAVGESYHGYWSEDLYALNPHFGSEKDLLDLSDALHKRDMLLMVDVVVNHMADGFDNKIPPKVDYAKFNPFNDEKFFHTYCNVTDWEDPKESQECWLYPYGIALADLDTDSKPVADEMNKWVKQLVANYSIDGLRIDAAKHVGDDFLKGFVKAAGVFSFGEVLTGEIDDFCPYQNNGILPGMPNYLEFYKINSAFKGGSFLPLKEIRDQAFTGCDDMFAMGSFIENHDMPRFPHDNKDLALAKNAMTYILMTDGIPTVYQGQEQHFFGGETPANREALWSSKYDTESDMYKLTATLNKLRRHAISQSDEWLESRSEAVLTEVQHFCIKKGANGNQIVTCITNKSSKGDSYDLVLEGFSPSDKVVEVVGCKTVTADATGSITMYMGQGEPKVYVTEAFLKDSGLCPKTEPDGPKASNQGDDDSAAGTVRLATGVVATLALGWAALFLA